LDDKPGSVGFPLENGPSFIWDRDCSRPPAAYPKASAGPASSAFLFGLAPDGVCQACRVAATAGGLLPHRFTLTPHLLLSTPSTYFSKGLLADY